MKEITVEAKVENIPAVTDFVNEVLEAHDCPIKVQMQIDVAIDELVSNIAFYAYEDGGDATISVDIVGEPETVVVSFKDRGKPYDPLKKEDPDVTLSLEERQIGGLGIYMVKKSMDEMLYEYRDGMNIVTIKKAM